ncbi:MAG TPA: ComF family protein [Clostridiales bacterium]|nr:ComF family protein [Clostridiales bacterium]
MAAFLPKQVKPLKKLSLAKIIWPTTRCVLCGENAVPEYPGLCRRCLERLFTNGEREVFCQSCGAFYPVPFKVCPNCFLKTPSYGKNGIFAAFPYDEDSGVLVKKLKYNNRRDLAETMAKLFFARVNLNAVDYDLVTAVPMHKKRLRERGYNQAAVFAQQIAQTLSLSFAGDLLCQKVETVSQTALAYRERLHNLKGAFSLGVPGELEGKRILLVDDVITTGATMKECGAVLRAAGAKKVVFVAFAAGKTQRGR